MGDIKMDKAVLNKKYIGDVFEDYGFQFKALTNGNCTLYKKEDGIVKTIQIISHKCDESLVTFELFTNVPRTGMVRAFDLKSANFNSDFPGYWRWENEQEYIQVIKSIAELLLEEGLSVFDKLSIRPESVDTDEMARNLFYHHDDLAKRFQEKYDIKEADFTKENIDSWFKIIMSRCEELKKENVSDVRNELLEMAAFLGVQIERNLQGKWSKYEKDNFIGCSLSEINSLGCSSINLLNILCSDYSNNDLQRTKDMYMEMYETQRPKEVVVTNEMVEELLKDHDRLAGEYKEKNGLNDSKFNAENVHIWFEAIHRDMDACKKLSEADVQKKFVEMAAFLGVQLEMHKSGEWKKCKQKGQISCKLVNLDTEFFRQIDVLNLLLEGYMNGVYVENIFVDMV